MGEYIAYYRGSTDRQGVSGLGIDAQRQAVQRYIGDAGQLAGEFTVSTMGVFVSFICFMKSFFKVRLWS